MIYNGFVNKKLLKMRGRATTKAKVSISLCFFYNLHQPLGFLHEKSLLMLVAGNNEFETYDVFGRQSAKFPLNVVIRQTAVLCFKVLLELRDVLFFELFNRNWLLLLLSKKVRLFVALKTLLIMRNVAQYDEKQGSTPTIWVRVAERQRLQVREC